MTGATALIILNLVVLESLLSVDNAAVLAAMVKDLPGKQGQRALRYGMIGAYAFRCICLFFASYLIKWWWLKSIGGLFLLYLVYKWWKGKQTETESDDYIGNKKNNWLYRNTVGLFGSFWSTIVLIEFMDLTFSVDNVVAAVGFSDELWVVMLGVCIGITAMRFVSGWFLKLMKKYPNLETSAFVVIGLLGLKLILAGFADYYEALSCIKAVLDRHITDIVFSAFMILIFFIPFIRSNNYKGIRAPMK